MTLDLILGVQFTLSSEVSLFLVIQLMYLIIITLLILRIMLLNVLGANVSGIHSLQQFNDEQFLTLIIL